MTRPGCTYELVAGSGMYGQALSRFPSLHDPRQRDRMEKVTRPLSLSTETPRNYALLTKERTRNPQYFHDAVGSFIRTHLCSFLQFVAIAWGLALNSRSIMFAVGIYEPRLVAFVAFIKIWQMKRLLSFFLDRKKIDGRIKRSEIQGKQHREYVRLIH